MSDIQKNIEAIKQLIPTHVKLVAVSKTKPAEMLKEAYDVGQRAFGENYVQELCEKQALLPTDIEWHFIGHLQSNKVRYIAPFVHWIHGVESEKLLAEINKQAEKHNRIIHCLLQIHIAEEESKFGFDVKEIESFCSKINTKKYDHVRICGLMGMSSFTENKEQVRSEFKVLKQIFTKVQTTDFKSNPDFTTISMGMSGDWQIAIEEGSTLVRIGSAIFGIRK